MKLRIAVPGNGIVEIDDASPEEAAAFIAALGKEGGQSATPPALTAPAAASSSSASLGTPEWFLQLPGRTRIVSEVLARVWSATSTGEGMDVHRLRNVLKWTTGSSVKPMGDDEFVAYLMEELAAVMRTSASHQPRRTVLMKRQATGGPIKLYAGKDILRVTQRICGRTCSEVVDAVIES